MSPGSRSPLTRGGQALWAVGTPVRPQGLCSSAVRTSSHLQRMRWAVCLAMGNVSPRTSSLMLTALCPHSEGGQQATPCCAPCHQTSGSSLGSCWCNVQNTQPTADLALHSWCPGPSWGLFLPGWSVQLQSPHLTPSRLPSTVHLPLCRPRVQATCSEVSGLKKPYGWNPEGLPLSHTGVRVPTAAVS